ncbi:MAG: helix-turn-helix domain-containing protein [Firmicutes bacterium]|nr:helix-turn-helix domain-containing protein [Bacillota bacterium]
MKIAIGQRTKELRTERGISQVEMAQVLDINDQSNYSKYETGKLSFTPEMIIKLSEFFNVTTDYILTGKE